MIGLLRRALLPALWSVASARGRGVHRLVPSGTAWQRCSRWLGPSEKMRQAPQDGGPSLQMPLMRRLAPNAQSAGGGSKA